VTLTLALAALAVLAVLAVCDPGGVTPAVGPGGAVTPAVLLTITPVSIFKRKRTHSKALHPFRQSV
jgi:hypothetical protein